MFAPIVHFQTNTSIRRYRLLPTPGKVLARIGQKVNAVDVVAEADLEPNHILLDIAKGLGVRKGKANQYLQRTVNEQVNGGDIIAGPVGIFNRTVRAPKDGKVVAIKTGQVLLETEGNKFCLCAGIPGLVTEIIPGHGVVVEATGLWVQGVWGNGRVDSGLLAVVDSFIEEELTTKQLDVSLRGSIMLAAHCSQVEALQMAETLPLRGLILSSMSANLIDAAQKVQYPIIVLEGFGQIPFRPEVYELITSNQKYEFTLNAQAWNRMTGERPELIIPQQNIEKVLPPANSAIFSPGQRVRIVHSLHVGKAAQLVALQPEKKLFDSGIRAYSALVRFTDGENAIIPLSNLEVLE